MGDDPIPRPCIYCDGEMICDEGVEPERRVWCCEDCDFVIGDWDVEDYYEVFSVH